MHTEALKVISRAKTHLMLRQPFFGALAMGLDFIEDTDIPTMCTDGKSVRYCPDFVMGHPIGEIEGVIAHEVMHVALMHMLRRGESNPEVWNVATDYAINQIVVDSGLVIPECGLLDEQYRGMSSEAIYNRLLSEGDTGKSLPDGWNFGEVVEASGDGGAPLSESEVKQMEQEVTIKVLSAHASAKNIGKVPAGIEGYIEQMSQAQVDWRDKMRLFIGGDQPDDYTWASPNRKWYGTYGIYMPSINHFGAGHLVIALDVSRSVTDEELGQYLGEVNAISEDMTPASITIIACDSSIQSVTVYEQGEIVEKLNATGRGGTRVTPVFDYIEEHGLHVDSMVYFTDLYVSDFPSAPDYPVLWVSTGDDSAPFGEVVRVS